MAEETVSNVSGGTQDAGAVIPEQSPTAAAGAEETTSAGTVSPESQPAAVEGVKADAAETTIKEEGGETTTEETATSGTEGYKLTLEERVAQLAERKAEEKIAELDRKRQELEAASKPQFAEIDYNAVNRDMNKSYAREQEILNEISLDPEQVDPALTQELRRIRIWRQQVENAIERNEKAKADFLAKQQEQQRYDAFWKVQNSKIQDTMKVLQDQEKVPDDVVAAGRSKWQQMCKDNPMLDRRFNEGIHANRVTEMVQWAWELVKQEMGKKEQELINQKEAAKESLPPGKTATGDMPVNLELQRLKERAQQTGNTEDLAAYSAAKRSAASQA